MNGSVRMYINDIVLIVKEEVSAFPPGRKGEISIRISETNSRSGKE